MFFGVSLELASKLISLGYVKLQIFVSRDHTRNQMWEKLRFVGLGWKCTLSLNNTASAHTGLLAASGQHYLSDMMGDEGRDFHCLTGWWLVMSDSLKQLLWTEFNSTFKTAAINPDFTSLWSTCAGRHSRGRLQTPTTTTFLKADCWYSRKTVSSVFFTNPGLNLHKCLI